jgi:PAS domain-containing protein
MPTARRQPSEENNYLAEHASCILDSLRRLTGRNLVPPEPTEREQARALFDAPFVVLSHDNADDPLLTYANRAGLKLFELTWEELIAFPSRRTAEPAHREERARLLATVARRGFIDDYRGIRVTRSGRRFVIEQATVWNLFDSRGEPSGQVATFRNWTFLD